MTKQPRGPPMPLGNMRALGVQRLVASCLNDGFSGVSLRFIRARTDDEIEALNDFDA